jgi:hypothetical protein
MRAFVNTEGHIYIAFAAHSSADSEIPLTDKLYKEIHPELFLEEIPLNSEGVPEYPEITGEFPLYPVDPTNKTYLFLRPEVAVAVRAIQTVQEAKDLIEAVTTLIPIASRGN